MFWYNKSHKIYYAAASQLALDMLLSLLLIWFQLTENRLKRNGNYLWNPYTAGEHEEIEGEEDSIPNPELLSAPFAVSHIKGSVRNLR